jgi:hypothetical protein
METIVIQTEDKNKAKAIKDFLKAFDINFKSELSEESPYNPEFVKKIKDRSESAREGNIIEYTDELKKELFGK